MRSGPFTTSELAARVIVTGHAKQRVIQRMKLFMFEHEQGNPELFVEREFRKSYLDMSVMMCPFEYNKLQLKHGQRAFKSHSKLLTLLGVIEYTNNTTRIIIKSVVKNEQNSCR